MSIRNWLLPDRETAPSLADRLAYLENANSQFPYRQLVGEPNAALGLRIRLSRTNRGLRPIEASRAN